SGLGVGDGLCDGCGVGLVLGCGVGDGVGAGVEAVVGAGLAAGGQPQGAAVGAGCGAGPPVDGGRVGALCVGAHCPGQTPPRSSSLVSTATWLTRASESWARVRAEAGSAGSSACSSRDCRVAKRDRISS